MYLMDYDSVKVTNYVQRFCIIPRVRNGVAEFTLLVQLVNNERTEVYDDTYEDPRDLLHDLRNGWYLGRGCRSRHIMRPSVTSRHTWTG